eukprot:9110089-Alexandrium_andersonii.AAC.1
MEGPFASAPAPSIETPSANRLGGSTSGVPPHPEVQPDPPQVPHAAPATRVVVPIPPSWGGLGGHSDSATVSTSQAG